MEGLVVVYLSVSVVHAVRCARSRRRRRSNKGAVDMKRHIKRLTIPGYAIVPRNPVEALWFRILDALGKPRILSL